MQKRQVVLWVLLPANQQTAEAIHPGVRPLHDPPARFEAGNPLDRFGRFPTRAHVRASCRTLSTWRTPHRSRRRPPDTFLVGALWWALAARRSGVRSSDVSTASPVAGPLPPPGQSAPPVPP